MQHVGMGKRLTLTIIINMHSLFTAFFKGVAIHGHVEGDKNFFRWNSGISKSLASAKRRISKQIKNR